MSRAHRSDDRATIEKLESLDEVLAAKLMRRREIAACSERTKMSDASVLLAAGISITT